MGVAAGTVGCPRLSILLDSHAADLALIPALGIFAHKRPGKGVIRPLPPRLPRQPVWPWTTGRHPVRDLQEKTC
jgi:hypothetical protein